MMITVIPIAIGALGTILKGLIKGLEALEISIYVETIQDYSTVKIGQNTENSPGDLLWRLVITQTPVRNHRLINTN